MDAQGRTYFTLGEGYDCPSHRECWSECSEEEGLWLLEHFAPPADDDTGLTGRAGDREEPGT